MANLSDYVLVINDYGTYTQFCPIIRIRTQRHATEQGGNNCVMELGEIEVELVQANTEYKDSLLDNEGMVRE